MSLFSNYFQEDWCLNSCYCREHFLLSCAA